MKFERVLKRATFLDPLNGFQDGGRDCEVRKDPLTGRNSRILFFPIRELPQPDYEQLKKKDPGFCPFCPENIKKITPKFNPALFTQERYSYGDAICFPNAFPYDENGAVTVLSKDHFLRISDLTEKIIADGISCCVDFLIDVKSNQPEAIYQSINWNYLPNGGSSILHPHLQVTASSVATNYYNDLCRTLNEYGDTLFSDLVDTEEGLGERFLSRDRYFSWIIAFAPQGMFDVIAISHAYFEPESLKKEEILNELVSGIKRVIDFIESKKVISYNMSLFFMIGNRKFIPHMRLCPRTTIPPLDTCEINYMKMLHNEPMSTMKPESVAEELKKIWW